MQDDKGAPPLDDASETPASAEAVRRFRATIAALRRARRGPVRSWVEKALATPLAFRQAILGVSRYGRAVRALDGTTVVRQFIALLQDYPLGIRPEDFYQHRLYRPERRALRSRHFPFSQVLALQQALIDRTPNPDFPLLRSKASFRKACAERGLPTIDVIAEFHRGAAEPAEPHIPDADLFTKPSDMMLGLGTRLWRRTAPYVYAPSSGGEALSRDDLMAELKRASLNVPDFGGSGALLLQVRAVNHPAILGALTQGGLATLRIVSHRAPDGRIELLPPVIRMPVGDAVADNIAQGGLAAPIDLASGRICGPAVRKDKRCGVTLHSAHPTTGTALTGFQIPCWREALEIVRRAHQAFPAMAFVGWDVAVLEQGPILLEGNGWWDSDLTVLPHGKTLSETAFVSGFNYHWSNPGRP